jgi:hypothetical protein
MVTLWAAVARPARVSRAVKRRIISVLDKRLATNLPGISEPPEKIVFTNTEGWNNRSATPLP